MEKVIETKRCTGCTACLNICPKKAISMVEGQDGFKYPVIDQEKCINCGICKKTCPVLNTTSNNSINKCYVGYAKDDKTKENASSGGIFPLLANYILDNNGIVIGAAFDESNKLNHIAITNKKELEKLKGSKYLQSDLDNIFTYIKDNIKDNKILFVGTPCQVSGLKAFLKKDYENLICIDLVCHGAPSPKLFEKYIKELEQKYNDKLTNYNFRDKSTGWDTYSNTATFKNNKITELNSKNNYMKLFLSDIALRESCYKCNFKLGNKYSDITLGDFWGVSIFYPEMYDNKGVSCIIINTKKGLNIFDIIKKELRYKECTLDKIISSNPSLNISCKYPKKRKSFFDELSFQAIDNLATKYKKNESLVKKIINRIKKIIKKVIK